MPFANSNGRLAAIFFLVLVAVTAHSQQISITQDMVVNRGLLDDKFWKDYSLRPESDRVIAYTDVGLQVGWQAFDQSFIYERKTINTLATNTNTLVLAARDGAYSSQLGNGQLALQAQTKRYKFDSWGLRWSRAWLSDSFVWAVSPKWIRLFDFREGNGVGSLVKDDVAMSLEGDLQRIGASSYGYQVDPAAMKFLTGGAVDAAVSWEDHSMKVSAQVQNLYSKVPVQSAFFSSRAYNVNATTAQGIAYSEVPSLRGSYGQQDMKLTLPRVVKTELAYKNGPADLWLKTGVIGVDGRNLPWLGAMYSIKDHQVEIRNYELNNTQFFYRTPSILNGHLSGEIMVVRDASSASKTLLGGLQIKF